MPIMDYLAKNGLVVAGVSRRQCFISLQNPEEPKKQGHMSRAEI